jgi:hypothetical protein
MVVPDTGRVNGSEAECVSVTSNQKICPDCGSTQPATSTHCGGCGGKLQMPADPRADAAAGLDFDFELDLSGNATPAPAPTPTPKSPDSRQRGLPAPAAGGGPAVAQSPSTLGDGSFELVLDGGAQSTTAPEIQPSAPAAGEGAGQVLRSEPAASPSMAGLDFGDADGVDGLEVDAAGLDVGLDLDEAELAEERRSEKQALASRPAHASNEASSAASSPGAKLLEAPVSLVLEVERIAELADYGPVPGAWWQTVPYSWRVLGRRKKLRSMHRHQLELHAATRQRVHLVAEQVMVNLQTTRSDDPELADYVSPIAEAEKVQANRSQQKASSDAHFAQQRQELQLEAQQQRTALESTGKRLQQARAVLEGKQAARARAAADVKRAERDLSVAYEKADAAATKGQEFASPEDAARIRELEGVKAQREERLTSAQLETVEAKQIIAEWTRKSKEQDSAKRRLMKKQQTLEHDARQTGTSRERDVEQARALRLQAAHDAAYRVLVEKSDWLSAQQRETLRAATAELDQSSNELGCYEQAVDAYLHDAFAKGWALQAGLLGAAVVALVLAFI